MEKIQIEKNEELGSIFAKLEKAKDGDITLSIAENAVVLRSVINLKMLKKRAEELGKSVIIERRKEDIASKEEKTDNVYSVKISQESDQDKTVEKNKIMRHIPEQGTENRMRDFRIPDKQLKVSSSIGRVKMFDIVKKYDDAEVKPEEKKVELKKDNIRIAAEKGNYSDAERYSPDYVKPSRPAQKMPEPDKKKRKTVLLPSIMSRIFYIFIFVVVATVLVSVAMALPKVNINITLKSHELEKELRLKVDEKVENIDADKGVIPAKIEESNGEVSETYPTTGKKHIVSKATGKITIYNEYSSNDQKIVATTRFLSKDGHVFRVNENVTIPGFSRVEGKDVPGEITVEVVADKAGEGYNIGATSFTIPGYQGGIKYSTIYARSNAAMTGGADREAMYFSESDYITAKEKLLKKVRENNNEEISGKQTDAYILLEGTRKEGDMKIITDVKVGDIADKFKMTVTVKDSGIFVSKENIDEIVDWKISSENDGSVEVLDNSRKHVMEAVEKDEDGSVILPVSVKQDVVAKIDVEKIKKDIFNKSEEEVRSYFQNINEFNSVDVTFSWTQKVPSASEKIYINIKK